MSYYVDFGAFTGKTGPATSYKNLLVDLFLRCLIRGSVCKPVGGAIYWYKVLCTSPTYDVIGSDITEGKGE